PRPLGARGHHALKLLKMTERGLAVMEKAKGNPAGEEFAFGGIDARLKAVRCHQRVSGAPMLGFRALEELARNQFAIGPYLQRIDELRLIRRYPEKDIGRLLVLISLAVVARQRILHRNLAAQRRRQAFVQLDDA